MKQQKRQIQKMGRTLKGFMNAQIIEPNDNFNLFSPNATKNTKEEHLKMSKFELARKSHQLEIPQSDDALDANIVDYTSIKDNDKKYN